jgi:hypothetical protein
MDGARSPDGLWFSDLEIILGARAHADHVVTRASARLTHRADGPSDTLTLLAVAPLTAKNGLRGKFGC